MSDSNFREIQLNTKQVVFLFMAFVVAAVSVFLLGVSVGRGVATDSSTADAATATETTAKAPVPDVMPPSTTPKPGELKYHGDLQGRDTASGAAATPPAAPPAALPDRSVTPTPSPTPATGAATKPAQPSPTPTPAKPTPTPAKPSPTPPPTGVFFVQVDSFSSKANADRRVAQLKAKGFSAFVFPAPGAGARFKVRLGPYADRPAAEAMRARLIKQGFEPSVIR